MDLLSCTNCLHNPLQLGQAGLPFGYCTQHILVLHDPDWTTCGRLLRKDLLLRRARSERAMHARRYVQEGVQMLAPGPTPEPPPTSPPIELPADSVLEETLRIAKAGSNSMLPLRTIEGGRADIAWLSFARVAFSGEADRGAGWRAGQRSLILVLDRLTAEPKLNATELRGPFAMSPSAYLPLAKWDILMLRLALMSDISEGADVPEVAALAELCERAAGETEPGDPADLRKFLCSAAEEIAAARPHLVQPKMHDRSSRRTIPDYHIEKRLYEANP